MKKYNSFTLLGTWFFLILLLVSCSKEEYINEDWSGKTSSKYKAIGYNFAIEVISRTETTFDAKMIWNELREDEVDCEVVTLDIRILDNYEICPYCPNLCDE